MRDSNRIVKEGILIIVPRYIPYNEKISYEFPLGLGYISASLKKAGYSVDVLNLNHYEGKQIDLIREKIEDKGFRFMLTGGLSAHYHQLKSITHDVKSLDPSIINVIGGGIITASPKLMFEYLCPDYVVVGEGEVTVVELVRENFNGCQDIASVNGIGYKDKTKGFVLTAPREPIMDLDSLPFPDFEGFEFEKFLAMQMPNDNLYMYVDDEPRFYPIISSRGCPYNCTFCFHPLGQKYRSRSVENVISEIKYITERYQVNNLAIVDELISNDRDRLFKICEELKTLPRKVHWMCQLRVDDVDEEMLSIMKDAGCFLISYGFESASDLVLKSMRKHITADQIENALKLSKNVGIGIQGYFIFGDPAETKQTAYETLNFWKKYKDSHITLGYIRPYPGSVLWKNILKSGSISSDEDQLQFLEKCISSPPNLSKLNEQEWFELQKEVQAALLSNDHFGMYIASERNSNNTYKITIRCPHCKHITTYDNFHQRILGVFKLACRHCHGAMNMTPLVFDHVRDDYQRNLTAYERITGGNEPIIVTPCMNPAEFAAMAENALQGISIECFMDANVEKTKTSYLGKPVLIRNRENVQKYRDSHYFVIPLTRFANRIYRHLISLGVDETHICRLDEIVVASDTAH
ncbi:MAG: B12-binding domain-containing radical SAM protein [Methanoregula sp.]